MVPSLNFLPSFACRETRPTSPPSASHFLPSNPSTSQVGDDVAVGRKQGALVGRRGLAGTVLVYKVAGALATEGAGIDEVHEIAEYVAERCGTIGSGLGHTHVGQDGRAVARQSLAR